jgi:membrane protease YdiL (CAAX protease family)
VLAVVVLITVCIIALLLLSRLRHATFVRAGCATGTAPLRRAELMVLGRWATVDLSIFAVVLSWVSAVIAVVGIQVMMPAHKFTGSDGTMLAVFELVSTPVQVVTLMLASRRSGFNVFAYLGLDILRRRHIVVTVAGLVVWTVFLATLGLALGRDMEPWFVKIYRSAQADGSLVWLWLAVVVAAPIGEELLFRGFMFRGFVHAPRDAIPSIVLISLIWSLGHIQYGWYEIAELFVFGVLLGLVRWSTGSTTLTILLHMVNNLVASIEMEFVLG